MAGLSKLLQEDATLRKDDTLPKMVIRYIHYSKMRSNKKQYCDAQDDEEIISLAWKIHAARGLLQPVVLRKTDTDEYDIIAGHKRRLAIKYLVEVMGFEQYALVPSYIKNESDVRTEFNLYASNGFHNKTDYEKMTELVEMKRLLEQYPDEFPEFPAGRIVEKLEKQIGMARSTIGEYLSIDKKLSEKGMEAFKSGEINKSAAVALASLSHEEQDTLLDEGVTKQKDIKAYKEEKTERIVHRTTVTDSVKNTIVHKVEDDTNTLSDSTSGVIDVLPGQYRVTNTDMDIEEVDVIEEKPLSEAVETNCKCSSCQKFTPFNYMFKFKNKHYCFNCLHNLIIDLAKNGVITIDHSNADTEGMIIHSQTEHGFS